MPKAKAKVELVFKMTKDAEPTIEKCVLCGRKSDVILEKKSMVRICHGCQEVTAATSDTQPPAVPGSGAAGGGGEPQPRAPWPDATSKEPRRKPLKRSDFIDHGFTTGCRGCDLITNERPGEVRHNEACKRRMERLKSVVIDIDEYLCDGPISGFARARLYRRINAKHYKRAWTLTKDREFARETGRKAWSQWVEAIAGRRTAVTRAAAPAVKKKKKKMPVVTASRKKPVKQTAPQRVAEPNHLPLGHYILLLLSDLEDYCK